MPYKGAAPGVTGLLGGEVQMAMVDLLQVLPHVDGREFEDPGRRQPDAARRRCPTCRRRRSSGLPGVVMDTTYGVIAPPGVPADVQKKFREAIVAAMQSTEMKDQLLKQGAVAMTSTPQEYSSQMQAEFEKWKRVVTKGKITLE